jgi:hypothetical protein
MISVESCPNHANCERMFRDIPPTSKEARSMRLLMKLRPDHYDEPEALQFVRVFSWQISRAPGGVEGLLREFAV